MAKVPKPEKEPIGGPYLDAAVICEQVIHEKRDGALSPIRLVNRLKFHGRSFNKGDTLALPLFALISFKAGDARGSRDLSLYVTGLSKERYLMPGAQQFSLAFHGDDTGAIAIFQLAAKYEGDGTYWIDVVLDNKCYARIPLTWLTNQPPAEEE